MKKPLASYHIDWLQLYCYCEVIPALAEPVLPTLWISPHADKFGNHREYRLEDTDRYTHGYSWSKVVMYKQYTIAYVSAIPSIEGRDPHGCSIRLANPVLYTSMWYFLLMDVLDTLHWTPRNITRCDLCCDQHYFMGGLLPSTFIRNYASKLHSYLRVGRLGDDFSLYGHKSQTSLDFSYIRWGSRSSGVAVYLYNKTKELDEVKDKPWIRKAWESDGLAPSKQVWRVEISITSQRLALQDITSHLFHTLFVDDLMTPDAVRRMFSVYAEKYFKFVRNVRGIAAKKDLPPMPLLNLDCTLPMRPKSVAVMKGAGRMEKMVASKLEELLQYVETSDMKEDERWPLQRAILSTKTYFRDLYQLKDAAAKQEAQPANDLRARVLRSLSIPETIDRLHTSREAATYYERCKEKVAEKIASTLAMSLSPPPRRQSEQQKPSPPTQT